MVNDVHPEPAASPRIYLKRSPIAREWRAVSDDQSTVIAWSMTSAHSHQITSAEDVSGGAAAIEALTNKRAHYCFLF
jgi:hypothetical protein